MATLVQSRSVTNGFDTNVSLAFSGNVVAGNAIVFGLSYNQTTDIVTSVTSALGLTYTRIDFGGAASQAIATYYAKNITGGAETVTVNFSGNCSAAIAIHEVSGLDTTAPLDVHSLTLSKTGSTSTDADVSGSVTTTTNGQFVFGAVVQYTGAGGSIWTHGTGFTAAQDIGVGDDTGYHLNTEYLVQTSAGAIQAKWTASTTANYHVAIATFKAASGSAAVIHRLSSLGAGQ